MASLARKRVEGEKRKAPEGDGKRGLDDLPGAEGRHGLGRLSGEGKVIRHVEPQWQGGGSRRGKGEGGEKRAGER